MKRIAGYFILVSVFSGLFGASAFAHGFLPSLIIWLAALALAGLIMLGIAWADP